MTKKIVGRLQTIPSLHSLGGEVSQGAGLGLTPLERSPSGSDQRGRTTAPRPSRLLAMLAPLPASARSCSRMAVVREPADGPHPEAQVAAVT